MIFPRKWTIRRPGFLIPVFFLSCCPVYGQAHWHDANTAALGGCYVSRTSTSSAGLNPAGLGRMDKSSFSLNHSRPFITPDLDIIALSVQFFLKRGGPGLTLSTMGITGMRQTSVWISYGLKLHPRLFAGAGIHLRNLGHRENAIYHFDAGYALGLQFRISNDLMLGAHMSRPAAWHSSSTGPARHSMLIATGLSYSFYKTASFHTEFLVRAGQTVQWRMGLSIIISDSLKVLLGSGTQPWSLSAGITMEFRSWGFSLAGIYCMDTGATPFTSLYHEW